MFDETVAIARELEDAETLTDEQKQKWHEAMENWRSLNAEVFYPQNTLNLLGARLLMLKPKVFRNS